MWYDCIMWYAHCSYTRKCVSRGERNTRNIRSIFIFNVLHFCLSACRLMLSTKMPIAIFHIRNHIRNVGQWQQLCSVLFIRWQFKMWRIWFHFEWSFEVAKLWLQPTNIFIQCLLKSNFRICYCLIMPPFRLQMRENMKKRNERASKPPNVMYILSVSAVKINTTKIQQRHSFCTFLRDQRRKRKEKHNSKMKHREIYFIWKASNLPWNSI